MPRRRYSGNSREELDQHLQQTALDCVKPYDSPQPIEELLGELQNMLDPARFQRIQAWHLARWEQLTPVQQRLLEKIYTILVVDRAPYHNQPPTESGTPEYDHDKKTAATYTFVVLKAIRHGLEDHPTLDEWWRTCAATGNRRVLRRAKRGLEKHAIKPFSAVETEEAEAYFETGRMPSALNELLVYLHITDWRHRKRPLPSGVTWGRSDERTSALSGRWIFTGSLADRVGVVRWQEKERKRQVKSLRFMYENLRRKNLIPTQQGHQMTRQNFEKWVKPKRRPVL